ncbi:MAG: c-type cytochrome biogenesis protein CcsB [Deltaproteobacteria bacterium]|nr:c-type cytochrome biogenesis protein CcsB [Deltaproteobacteria bacterium]
MLAYLAAGCLFLVAVLRDSARRRAAARTVLAAGLGAHSVALLLRWRDLYGVALAHAASPDFSERLRLVFLYVPLSNFYESLVFFAWCLPFTALVVFRRQRQPYVGVVVGLLAALILAYASLRVDSHIRPLMPALKSNWLLIHVVTCFLGYAAFALACGAALLYLWQARRPAAGLPALSELDRFIYQAVVVGFVFLTLGILTGAVWAESAWGRYWSWDPKETWSLITWFIYATLLHARLAKGWQGRRIAWLAVVGFLAVLFTYLGVSFLLPGLHSYLT